MKIKLIDFGGQVPKRAHENDAGADVFAMEDAYIAPNGNLRLRLGFGLELPDGLAGYIFPRSGLAAKGIVCELPPIDSGYRGEVHAIIHNGSDCGYYIQAGDRVGQLVITPVILADFVTENFAERGAGAFGSTGR